MLHLFGSPPLRTLVCVLVTHVRCQKSERASGWKGQHVGGQAIRNGQLIRHFSRLSEKAQKAVCTYFVDENAETEVQGAGNTGQKEQEL